MQTPTQAQVDEALARLAAALPTHALPTRSGHYRIAAAAEFMLMPSGDQAFDHFKHRDTRNYIYVRRATGKIQLGDGDSAFNRHDFTHYEFPQEGGAKQ